MTTYPQRPERWTRPAELSQASHLEQTLAFQLSALNVPPFETEYRFDGTRRFRFDFAWPEYKIAAEVEGATYQNGRHTRGSGFHNDCIKYNLAASQGWLVFRYDGQLVTSGEAAQQLESVLQDVI